MPHGKKKRIIKEAGKVNAPLLTIKNLDTWYSSEKKVLRSLSLDLTEHEVVGLIG